MFEDMYPQAVEAGIPATEFWNMTLEEIMVQTQANKKRHENDLRERAMFDYSQQRLSIYSFNDPKNFPDFEKAYPFLADVKKEVEKQKSEEELAIEEMKRDQAIMMQNVQAIKATQERKKGE